MSETYAIYIVSFNDPERKSRMDERFKKNGLYAHYVKPVCNTDPRISAYDINDFEKRVWSIFFQHIDSWRQFYEETNADYCIVCEDDIYISNRLKKQIPEVIQLFKEKSLDILLLSYLWQYNGFDDNFFPVLCSNKPDEEPNENSDKPDEWRYFELRGYPDDLWGAHMYMVSREHVGRMLERYTPEYAFNCIETGNHFNPDWQFTKWGNRAILSPMIGVEEGNVKTDHQGQINFHRECMRVNYSSEKFV
jgi:hypothetical protein